MHPTSRPMFRSRAVASQTSLKVGMSGKVGSRTMLPSSSNAPKVIIGTAVPASTSGVTPLR